MSISNYEKEPFFDNKRIYSATDKEKISATDKEKIRFALKFVTTSYKSDQYKSDYKLMHELWDGAKLESDRIEYLIGLAINIMRDQKKGHFSLTKTEKKRFEKLSKIFPFEEIEEKEIIDKVETEKNDNVITINKFKKNKKEK